MPKPIIANRSPRAVFLMYHSIADEGPQYLSLPPTLFERQLALFHRLGYRSGTMSDLADLQRGVKLDAPRVFITFDDGFADNHAAALPLLQQYGFGGVVFVLPPLVDAAAPLDWVGVEQELERYPDTMRSMNWKMVEEMAEAGVVIGSHTLTHRRLDLLGGEELRDELLDSRRAIEQRLGSCETVAYPFGDYNAEILAAAQDVGYRFGFVIAPLAVRHAQPLSIPRLPVDFRDDERRLRAKLSMIGRRVYLSPVRPALAGIAGSVRSKLGR